MKKQLALVLCTALLSSGCAQTYTAENLRTFNHETYDANRVPLAVKDFKVVQPVFAQSTVTLSDQLSHELLQNENSNNQVTLRKLSTSGSYIIHRRLLDEAFKAGADAIADIHIEYERYCQRQSEAPNATFKIRPQESQNQKANIVLYDLAPLDELAPIIDPSNRTYKLACEIQLYGSALAIKYTDAVCAPQSAPTSSKK